MPIDGVLYLHTFSPKDVKDLVPEYIGECLAAAASPRSASSTARARGPSRRSSRACSKDPGSADFRGTPGIDARRLGRHPRPARSELEAVRELVAEPGRCRPGPARSSEVSRIGIIPPALLRPDEIEHRTRPELPAQNDRPPERLEAEVGIGERERSRRAGSLPRPDQRCTRRSPRRRRSSKRRCRSNQNRTSGRHGGAPPKAEKSPTAKYGWR